MRVGLISLGCPKNLVDSEIMIGILERQGLDLTYNLEEADAVIINTCAFIQSAQEEAINTILEAAELKGKRCRALIVAGCLAERYKEEIIKEIPEVDAVVGTGSVEDIYEVLLSVIGEHSGEKTVMCSLPDGLDYLEGPRYLSDNNPYKYLKIAEGCSNCCTYCIIPSLRGRFRSRDMENVIKEAKMLVQNGAKEIVLIAQDVTGYGEDLYGEPRLVELLQGITALDGLLWVRLLYCYPERITERLIREIADNPKICRYIDIPVQHFSDGILKAMARKGDSKKIRDVIIRLREAIPDIALRTSLITGFPGETEEDFEILKAYAREMEFNHLGVFAYSREEGTKAALFECQIDDEIREKRRDIIMSIQQEIVRKKNECRIGKTYTALVEGVAEDGIFYTGRSYMEAPEIDTLLYFTSPEPLEFGQIVSVKILHYQEYDLIGEVVVELPGGRYEST